MMLRVLCSFVCCVAALLLSACSPGPTLRELANRMVCTVRQVDPMVLAYQLRSGALFQSDTFFSGSSPDEDALHAAITELGFEVLTIVEGDGGTLQYGELLASAGPSP